MLARNLKYLTEKVCGEKNKTAETSENESNGNDIGRNNDKRDEHRYRVEKV